MTQQNDFDRLAQLLVEIRDNQRVHLERQGEALAMQRDQYEFVKGQYEKTKAIQAKAEAIQEKSAWLVEQSRRAFVVILPMIILLVIGLAVLMCWL